MNFMNSIAKNSNFAFFPANFWWFFFRISRQIPENSDVCRFFNQICENKSEICRKFWILWKLFTIIQNYSLVSLKVSAIIDESRGPRRAVARARCRQAVPELLRLAGRAGRRCRYYLGWKVRWRRGTEPNELFRSEVGQNSWNRKKTTRSSFKIQEFSLENWNKSENFNIF